MTHPIEAQISAIMSDGRERTINDLDTRIDWSKHSIREALWRMVDAGELMATPNTSFKLIVYERIVS